ncbi:putative phospholipase B-like 2 [Leptotrombidium deliense]|uniref:Putative phospholipase B-like 2 n=1 Tax=Leptotrombidium deliense TaxID=299467 RepID=A0A443SUM9_9ACAR|nr:putative phospholipase B-like 2 [Leptotrombidium deliense]
MKSNARFNDTSQAYFSGLFEAFVSHQLIRMHFNNTQLDYCKHEQQYCKRLNTFIRKFLEFAERNVNKHRSQSAYWHQVGLVLEQMQGLNDGLQIMATNRSLNKYSYRATNININIDSLLKPRSVLWLNLITELNDFEVMLNRTVASKLFPNTSCSALIKLINNGSDVLASHNSWITYNNMLRVIKKYGFEFHKTADPNSERIPGHTTSMSSYPGVVYSIDDWYILSSKLLVLETTIENFNKELYKSITPDSIVLEFIRTLIANRLATSGKQWTSIFSEYNSGTYNNQFMIVDYKQFSLASYSVSPKNNILWIIEQSPGKTEAADVTNVLYSQEYWASYNVPYFRSIFEREMYDEKVKQFGNYYSYNMTARARIFRRDHSKVTDLKSLYKLMRYNDFKNDPYSRCNCTPPYSAHLAIAARNDLNDPNGSYPIDSLAFSSEGAIDVKMTSFELMQKYEMIAVSGPTYNPLPPFQWSTSKLEKIVRHEGQPDLWTWAQLEMKTNCNFNDSLQAYFAGRLEANLTYYLIKHHFSNTLTDYCVNETDYCERLREFIKISLLFAKNNIEKYSREIGYWHQLALVLLQLQGINDGIEHGFVERMQIGNKFEVTSIEIDIESLLKRESVLWLNLLIEFMDLEIMLNRTHRSSVVPVSPCSALIKLTHNNSDLLVAHDVWMTYYFLLRVMKKYEFHYHETANPKSKRIVGHTMSMSSYPGVIYSVDDYYILSSNLVIMETTNPNYNYDLYKSIKANEIVMEFIRNLIANRLAKNGKQWTKIFRKYNSGTYNNQFMIVDYKQFNGEMNALSPKDVLWIIEQSPGFSVAADVTDVLWRRGYWSSYNIPYFHSIYQRMNYDKKAKQFGEYFSYDECARAKIFRRDEKQVSDLQTMLRLMRYNDFKRDPFSRCNCTPPYSAILAIASRGDLNDPHGIYPFDGIGFSCESSIDVKITNSQLQSKYEIYAISGPTYDPLPAFQWSNSPFRETVRHEGQPDLWKFPAVHFKWKFESFKNACIVD